MGVLLFRNQFHRGGFITTKRKHPLSVAVYNSNQKSPRMKFVELFEENNFNW